MKALFLLLIVSIFLFSACSTTPTPSQVQQGVSSALDIASLAIQTYSNVKGNQNLSNQQIATLAANDLNGVAAVAQAYVGTNSKASVIVQGAQNTTAIATVVADLPPGPVTQSTVNMLNSAASEVRSSGNP
jgi:hypothetical protein